MIKNKNVLVTGISGFVGGNIAKKLISEGANVFGLVRDQKPMPFLKISDISNNVSFFHGELTDLPLMERIISENEINVVFHLAAQVEVGIGKLNPFLTRESNVRGTYTLLEAARRFSDTIEAVVVASSDKAYGDYPVDAMPYQEDYPLKAEFPYDTSKACTDMISKSYACSAIKLPVARFCNIYGPGQLNFSAIVPGAFKAIIHNESLLMRSDGLAVRDFLFVEDVADLYIAIATHLLDRPDTYRGEIYNAGPNEPISMRSLLENIYSLTGKVDEFQNLLATMDGNITTGELSYQSMDHQKVKNDFGWEPQTNLKTGLSQSYAWYQDYFSYVD